MMMMLTPGASTRMAGQPRAARGAVVSQFLAPVRPAPAGRAVTRPAAVASSPSGRDLLPKGRSLRAMSPPHAEANGNGNGAVSINRQPTKAVLDVLQQANAVCFDVDHTITINDTLDLLAEFMGVGAEVADLTNKAMDGTMNLEESLEERLKIINCKPADIKAFLQAHPPETRLTKGIKSLIKNLQARGVSVYLITGGFRELAMPIADCLDIPRERVFANRMLWQWDDETMEPTRLVGFDMSEPTARNQGKPQAIAMIREQNPYNTVVMIGDGITDLEAVQVSGGADLFIGYGGAAERPAVQAGADWYVYDWAEVETALKRYKVAMIGSGAWACAAARMVAQSCKEDPSDEFDESIRMWVYEEELGGRKLSEIINEVHENPMYLPGITLPENVEATADLVQAVQDADMLIFCTPHQYIRGICKQLVGKVKPGAIAISLIKGMSVRRDGPQLISKLVSRSLGIDCSVLMGANLAEGIAREELSEAVIGYNNLENARAFKKIFERPYFRVNLLPDAPGAEMCGTLKNIVALASGFVDGLGYGPNSKAAIMRQGLSEMMQFSQALYPTVRDDTFMESCGMADLVATCYGGRNLRVSRAYAEAWKAGTPMTFATLEARLLNGHKLGGVQTSMEVQEILRMRGWEKDYPLFTTVNRIINQQLDPTYVVKYVQGANKYIPPPSDAPVEESVPVEAAAPKKPRFAPLQLTL